MKNKIYSLGGVNVTKDEGVEISGQYSILYHSMKKARQCARRAAREYADSDDVINISVYAGEYMDKEGNVWGEPFDVYTVSNKDKETTMAAREKAGYVRLEVDNYTV